MPLKLSRRNQRRRANVGLDRHPHDLPFIQAQDGYLVMVPVFFLAIAIYEFYNSQALLPLLMSQAYLHMSSLTFVAYLRDKVNSKTSGRRTSEALLHLLAFCFGWPGALLAQQIFRHKTSKSGFVARTLAVAFANLALVGLAISLH